MVAHWARQTRRAVHGALLATPPDFETPMPDGLSDARGAARRRLAAGAARAAAVPEHRRREPQRPAGALRARRRRWPRDWGSELVDLGEVGHLNPASGYGEWPRRRRAHRALSHRATPVRARARRSRRRGSERVASTPKETPWPRPFASTQTGGPEVLELETVEVGEPGPGQARVRHSYVAVNFIDIYFRTGRYPLPLPNGLGSDAVGVVEAVGEGVTDIRAGDRVGYLLGPQGAYADVRVMPADVLIPLPDGVSRPHRLDADDEGHDGAVPVPPGLSAQGRRDHPVPRRRRRRRPGRLPVGARHRRDDDRHRQHRREGRGRARATAAPTPSSPRARTSPSACARSPTARACRWSTTRSARTR